MKCIKEFIPIDFRIFTIATRYAFSITSNRLRMDGKWNNVKNFYQKNLEFSECGSESDVLASLMGHSH